MRILFLDSDCITAIIYGILFTNVLFGILDILRASDIWVSKSNITKNDMEICNIENINLYFYLLGSVSITQSLLFVFSFGYVIIYSIAFCCSLPIYGILIWGMTLIYNNKNDNCYIERYLFYRSIITFSVWSVIFIILIISSFYNFVCFIIDNHNKNNIILDHHKTRK
jgi:hypothetical protein